MLIGKSAEEIQEIFQKFVESSIKIRLTHNVQKTVYLNNEGENGITKEAIEIGNEKIERSTEAIYLGQIIAFENRQGRKLKKRKKKAWKSFWTLKHYV